MATTPATTSLTISAAGEDPTPRLPPLDFLAHELRRWGFDPTKQDDEIDMYTHDQAAIALAFGLIKLEGSCDPATGDAALAAIGRQRDPSLAERFGWRQPTPDMDAAYAKLRAVLGRMPMDEGV